MLKKSLRRQFLRKALGLGGAAATLGVVGADAEAAQTPSVGGASGPGGLAQLHLARDGRSRRQSSWARSGGNVDSVPIAPGETAVMADISGAGTIRHIWLTISTDEPDYLRKLVFRAYWDGTTTPSVESPVGDFFGVGHARVANYWSQPLNMVTGGPLVLGHRAAMNCFFPMPFTEGARITMENQGDEPVRALYFYVDYQELDRAPADALRFHASWRREMPTEPTLGLSGPGVDFARTNELVNLDGRRNYLVLEAEGRGHYVGCNLSIDNINPIRDFGWFGEGDDFFWIDGEETPSLRGTGTEDYFCAAWGYPGSSNAMPYHGISYTNGPTEGPKRYSGKWTMYRYHIEDPILFERSLRFSIEHGHANVHANDYASVAYWYQTLPHKPFATLLPVADRLPVSDADSLRGFFGSM